MRWLVPSAAAVVVIGGGAAAGTIVASADPSLPDRSAAQLLVDVQNAKVDGLSGTIVESADLGLGAIANLTQGKGDLASLLGGSNTARVWYAGQTKARVALIGTQGETDVIRNGSDVYVWKSTDKTASHFTVPADAGAAKEKLNSGTTTPQEAADAALAAIDPTTSVSTTGAAKVAGRDAYELVLSPKDTTSLIGQVRLAIDAETHIPLRVDVYAKNATSPAVRVAFQQISFAVPDEQQFVFKAPPGTTVQESTADDVEKGLSEQHKAAATAGTGKLAAEGGPTTIGTGWTTIITAKLPKSDASSSTSADAKQLESLAGVLPQVSGSWGKGRLFAGTLFSVLITDDGRVFAGAVTPEKLYEAAA